LGCGLGNLPATLSANESALQTLSIVDAIRRHDRRTVENLAALVTPPAGGDPAADSVELLNHLVAIERSRWLPFAPDSWQRASAPPLGQCLHDPFGQGALSAYLAVREGESLVVAQRDQDARRVFDEVVQMSDAADWTRREAEAIVAVMDVAEGDPDLVAALSRAEHVGAPADAALWLHVAAGIAHGLRGEVSGLRRRTEALSSAHDSTHSWLLGQCIRMLIGVTTWRKPSVAPLLEPPPAGLPTSVAKALGIVETIDRQGRSCAIGGPLEHAIAGARRALADASPRRLETCLEDWHDISSLVDQHPRSAVEVNVLLAVSEMRRDREGVAVEWIERAIELASPSGLWGPLLAYERDLKGVLERRGWQLGAAHPGAVDMLENLRADHTAPTEALTDRERVVLRYLPTLMSNAEIATEMVVSVNTVKTHLKSIYRKLGVERRRDALLRARQVELL
jgi:DNA-binding CsgD family transcriptional regulator